MPIDPKHLIENTRQILNELKIQSPDKIQKLIDMKKRYPNATTNINEIFIQINPNLFVFKPFWEIEYLNLVKYATDRSKRLNFITEPNERCPMVAVCHLSQGNFLKMRHQEQKQQPKMRCSICIRNNNGEMLDSYITRKYNNLRHVISESIKEYMEKKHINSELSQNDKRMIDDQIKNNREQMALLTEYNNMVTEINRTDISILARYYTYDSYEIEISILHCDNCRCQEYGLVLCAEINQLSIKKRDTDICLSCNRKGECHEDLFLDMKLHSNCSVCQMKCIPTVSEIMQQYQQNIDNREFYKNVFILLGLSTFIYFVNKS